MSVITAAYVNVLHLKGPGKLVHINRIPNFGLLGCIDDARTIPGQRCGERYWLNHLRC